MDACIFKTNLDASYLVLGSGAPLAPGILQTDSATVIIDTVRFHAALAFPLTTSNAMFRFIALWLRENWKQNPGWETRNRGTVGPTTNCMKEYK